AAVWGRIAVGMTFTDDGSSKAVVPRVLVDEGAGATLEPGWVTSPEQGPMRLATFVFDADQVEEGLHSLTPVVTAADGTEIVGEAVQIRVLRARPADL